MAEILLSLTIIGVVAAITLPSLTGNINERTWNTQRKALYARFSQAVSLMPSLNGYGSYQTDDDGNVTEDSATETFITNGLAKVLKINNICDNEHMQDCGLANSFITLTGSKMTFPTKLSELNSTMVGSLYYGGHTYQNSTDPKSAAFETQNGETIIVYYNPKCTINMNKSIFHFGQSKICANFVYDLNGSKGPNTVGKDIGFITALYAVDPVVVAPMPASRDAATNVNFTTANERCRLQDSESRLPNIDELNAMYLNRSLLGITKNYYWSSSAIVLDGVKKIWVMFWYDGAGGISPDSITSGNPTARCVKR